MKLASKASNRLSRKQWRQVGIALVLTTSALDAGAAGLGRLNLMSGIGQPLRAEIEVTALNKDEIASLGARLASPDAFGQAGIEFGSALSGLRFSIQRRADGQPYVLVTSNALVNDPYLDMLVELSWSSGRLVREYTMLLDPPESRAARSTIDPGQTIVQAQSAAVARVAARTADASVAADRPATASPTPPASTGASYVVQNGDTAMSIARANKTDSVSLEQMLAALYQGNPQAFNGNINRLMAGASVRIPDAAAAQSLDGAEAHRIVAQSANFGRYRERLAQNAAAAPTSRADGPQASGRLTTQVQDNSAPSTEARDRLQLSRPDATRAAAAGSAPAANAGRSASEELASKDRELVESRSRLAQLEKNVADLQQLLKLKNQTLAELQKAPAPAAEAASSSALAAPAPTPAPPAAAPPATAVIAPPVASPAPEAAPPASIQAPPAAAPAPVPSPPKAAPAPMQASSDSDGPWYEALLDNTLLLVGLIVVVLLLAGYALVTMRRRRKLAGFEDSIFVDNSVLHANSVFGTTGGQSVDTANSGFHSNFVPVAGSLPDQTEVDPVAEADVYVAYGRDAQAEEILKEALRNDGTRQAVRLKLLEIYAKRGDAKTFETTASELYAATGGQGDDWKQAATLGASFDPRNPLYAEAVNPTHAPAPVVSNAPSSADRAAAIAAAQMAFSMSDLGDVSEEPPSPPTAADYTRTDPLPRSSAPAAVAPPSMDLDFDLGLGGGSVAPLATGAMSSTGAPHAGGNEPFDFNTSDSMPLVDPFTASAFSSSDSATRTAVNLPAFRARADQPMTADRPAAPPAPSPVDNEGFSASDIFGSSIVDDTEPYSGMPRDLSSSNARTSDFQHDANANAFERTEPLDAFNKISLDLDHDDFAPADKADFGAKTEVWQAMATKLDLALAYSDIGDKDGARELLEEVVRNGDATQSDRARSLIGQLA